HAAPRSTLWLRSRRQRSASFSSSGPPLPPPRRRLHDGRARLRTWGGASPYPVPCLLGRLSTRFRPRTALGRSPGALQNVAIDGLSHTALVIAAGYGPAPSLQFR